MKPIKKDCGILEIRQEVNKLIDVIRKERNARSNLELRLQIVESHLKSLREAKNA